MLSSVDFVYLAELSTWTLEAEGARQRSLVGTQMGPERVNVTLHDEIIGVLSPMSCYKGCLLPNF